MANNKKTTAVQSISSKLPAQAAMSNRDTSVTALCDELGVSKSTLYKHVAPDGKLTVYGERLLGINGNGMAG